MIAKKRETTELVWHISVFVFAFVWFTQIHPLTVYDADDWRYVSHVRMALPLWGDWNPSRVFPEVFMPLLSAVAVHTLMPVLGDYLQSLTVAHGFVVALAVTGYMYCFFRMVKRMFSLSQQGNVFVSALFLIFHFLIFRSYDNGNTYLFYCWDLTCYYYYLIPSLLNASVVMCMVGRQDLKRQVKRMSREQQGLLLAVLYFAVFSNLPASGILAAYAGSVLLVKGVLLLQNKGKWSNFWKENGLYLGIFLLWLVSAVFELCGGRAGAEDMGVRVPFLQGIKQAAYAFTRLPSYSNPMFKWVVFVLGGGTLWLLLQEKNGQERQNAFDAVVCMIAFGAMLVYAVLLCAAVDLSYVNRTEYQFGFLFYLLLLCGMAFAYILQKLPKIYWIAPVLLIVLIVECNTLDRTYLESNQTDLDPKICNQIAQDMIDQFVAADQAGEDTLTLYMPVWDSPDNWPHSTYIGEKMTDSLYEHGIISRKMKVDPCPAVDYNIKYGLILPNSGT